MPTYAIGDVQGCHAELMSLLERLAFDPARDHLWFAGDLVNRGPDSLAVLRFVRGLGTSAVTVLGNHDLHLLALAAGNHKHAGKSTLDAVLAAPDRDELLDWLRHRPLLHHDTGLGYAMVHAGLPPQWDLTEAATHAAELEAVLRGPGYRDFLHAMYGNQPARWQPGLRGVERWRFITNAFTRLRYCSTDGTLALKEKGALGAQSPGLLPWFQVPGRRSAASRILFGHWSTLGYRAGDNTWALDSGCLWGGALTAVRLDATGPSAPIQLDCRGYLRPGTDA
ncbi:symmetrical bis(5'-nucleosyl)-tetraphosphatase [Marichromatium bheemlicum]|uniref:Bis(5'-nucleosyl)-tetraphosphatase, symmetrical n=1 Tax=Marichromatium bheemlicum TaxID=365339 RepID=A0ABX1I7Q6_9GAMM|nr:symmetrical bis(5'-nucleosyl)-tetraphosphatase [Marichromatium bheemlicum]NKN32786.1 symmetrical bis(5'-nucleosyl)-tetraphosphatase [Marichromatium bheemlicum]